MTVDPILSYDFAAIEHTVRQDIHTTSMRFNAALDELRSAIAPLQATWTREAAEAYRVQQGNWQLAAAGLNDILVRLGHAVADGAAEIADTDRRAANAWR